MTKLVWDSSQAPSVKVGLDRGVLYFRSYGPKVWNGLSKIQEKVDGSDTNVAYFDGQKFVQQKTSESYTATAEAYSYPEELDNNDVFDFSYRVMLDLGYEIHIVYNAIATPQDIAYPTINSNSDLAMFNWDVYAKPVRINSYRASAHFVINSNYANLSALSSVENFLYGTKTTSPRMPTIDELLAMFDSYTTFFIVDNGDGTFDATGPDSWFATIDSTTVDITTPSVDYVDSESYTIGSW